MLEEVAVTDESPQNTNIALEEEVRECSGQSLKRPNTRARKTVNMLRSNETAEEAYVDQFVPNLNGDSAEDQNEVAVLELHGHQKKRTLKYATKYVESQATNLR